MGAHLNLRFPKRFFRDYANGKPCLIRVAAACGYQCDHGTTVLCHPSVSGLKATGSRKASVPDIGAAHGCFVCHELVDGRRYPANGSPFDDVYKHDPQTYKMAMQNALLEGVIRTISRLVKDGVLPNP